MTERFQEKKKLGNKKAVEFVLLAPDAERVRALREISINGIPTPIR
jgi:hypothetical protein